MNILDYKWWWSRWPGRPWTYIIRDAWHKFEGIWIIGLVAAGALLGHYLWELIFWLLLAFALGYIAGHLFWGKKYIPRQGLKPTITQRLEGGYQIHHFE